MLRHSRYMFSFKGAFIWAAILIAAGCFREDKKKLAPDKEAPIQTSTDDVFAVAKRRGLTDNELLGAAQTFMPTGVHDPILGLMSTGTGGRLAVYGMPSMRVIKYVGVFTPEPWQGFAYDDESNAMIQGGGREDIVYRFGEIGEPALSLKNQDYDGRTAFLVDAANARVAVLDLEDFETKQIAVNPVYRNSYHALAVTPNSEFVVQNTEEPSIFGDKPIPASGKLRDAALRGGLTLWRVGRNFHTEKLAEKSDKSEPASTREVPDHQYGELHDYISTADSLTIELPPYLQGRSVAGRGASDGLVFTLGKCRTSTPNFSFNSPCQKYALGSVLHVTNWKAVKALAQTMEGTHPVIPLADAAAKGIVQQVALPPGAGDLAISSDGSKIAVTFHGERSVRIVEVSQVLNLLGKPSLEAGKAPNDEFGVPTIPIEQVQAANIEISGPASGAVFVSNETLYVTVATPGGLHRIDLKSNKVTSSRQLDFEPAGLMIPGAGTSKIMTEYAVVLNKRPHGRFVSVGPSMSLNPVLIDIGSVSMPVLYDMAAPQATALWQVGFDASLLKPTIRYKPGTNSRTGGISLLKTIAGDERVVKEGKHVHVFATVIRSHITPDLVEVDEGDTVSFHITNLEQAQDQTHGFTVDTYNVHGSWEPGKTASVTFKANRPGVYPFYCTEFCSALHLEMEGYLLVKPKGWRPSDADTMSKKGEDQASKRNEYEQRVADIKGTQAKIDEVVLWLKEHHYEKEPRAAALVQDALAQLEEIKKVQPKVDTAIAANDWATASLWAGQILQYQVKAADAGLRAKKIVSEKGAN